MSRKKSRGPRSAQFSSSSVSPSGRSPDDLMRDLVREMAAHSSAEALNDNVLIPFMAALEKIAEDRGYVLNIYGKKSNLVFTGEDHAEQIYQLIERYLDDNTG